MNIKDKHGNRSIRNIISASHWRIFSKLKGMSGNGVKYLFNLQKKTTTMESIYNLIRSNACYIFVLIFLSVSEDCSCQHFSITTFLNEDNQIELLVDNYCWEDVIWETRDTNSYEWVEIDEGVGNPLMLNAEDFDFNNSIFRAKARIEESLPFDYSDSLKIKVIHSFSDLNVGDTYKGTFVYFNQSDTLLCGKLVNTNSKWGCPGTSTTYATHYDIGYGPKNTQEMIDNCNDYNIANEVTDNTYSGFDDWYFPSRNELRPIRNTLQIRNQVPNHALHSSTQSSKKYHWAINTSNTYGTYYNGLDLTAIVASRSIDTLTEQKTPTTIKFNIPFQDQKNHISVKKDSLNPHNLWVEYTGPSKPNMEYYWNFDTPEGIITEGAGKGPLLVNFNYSGYFYAKLNIGTANCISDVSYSSYKQNLELFKKENFNLPNSFFGDFSGFDYNNDGLNDYLISGNDTTQLYTGFLIDTFYSKGSQIPNLDSSYFDIGDYNNDNYLDIITTGYSSIDSLCYTGLFQNINNIFSEETSNFISSKNGMIKWLDINNDGFLDVIVTGENNLNEPIAKLYQNNRNGEFFEYLNHNIVPVKNSTISLEDYNKDGYTDILILGNDGEQRLSKIYKNDKDSLIDIDASLINVDWADAAWADIDNDGSLDFIISGADKDLDIQINGNSISIHTGNTREKQGYRYIGNDEFEAISKSTTNGNSYGSLDFGDYDNDGDDDLLAVGISHNFQTITSGSTHFSFDNLMNIYLYRNDGENRFRNVYANLPVSQSADFPWSSYSLSGNSITEGKFFDFNHDGNLDIIRDGKAAIYSNLLNRTNLPPELPTNLWANFSKCDSVVLSWDLVYDDHTPTPSIWYEIYIGTEPGKGNIFSKVNKRKIRTNHFPVHGLKPGTYYWAVQAVDNGRMASEWCEEQRFTIHKLDAPIVTAIDTLLTSSYSTGNQWYDLDGPIIGATDNTYIANPGGVYYVIATVNGCVSDTSNLVQVAITGTEELVKSKIEIYPNPFQDQLFISSNVTGQGVLINSLGQTIKKFKMNGEVNLNVSGLTPGSYLLKIFNGDKTLLNKILIKSKY